MEEKPKINIIPSRGRILHLLLRHLKKLNVELSVSNRGLADFLKLHFDRAVIEEVARRAFAQSERLLQDDNERYVGRRVYTLQIILKSVDTTPLMNDVSEFIKRMVR